MKNNKGFTLIELLATILILGMLASISYISISSIIDKNNKKECANFKESVRLAIREYNSDIVYSVTGTVTLNNLITKKYLTSDYIEKKNISEDTLNTFFYLKGYSNKSETELNTENEATIEKLCTSE